MRNNPVYKREMAVRARSPRIPVLIMLFNGILAAAALLNMYSSIVQVRISNTIRYESFLQLYAFVATLEFLLLMFIMPALTSASISGERERHTLELMFTTRLRAADIVAGKLMSALSQLLVMAFSSFPVLLLTFVYGSMNLKDLALLMFCFVTVALFCGSLGIFASALMRRSTFSNVVTYGTLLAAVAGTYLFNQFLLNVSQMEVNSMILQAGEVRPAPSSGWAAYLLLLNPAATFAELLESQVSGGGGQFTVRYFLGAASGNFITEHWVFVSAAIQLALSAVLLRGAVWFLEPVRRKRK
ncbi:MAG TPA: ABC transporter permease subunit [Candidatus Copromonas avistercoris]|nr:ABC transporter permease subunit [Candidatus Copromonas avistercoris]